MFKLHPWTYANFTSEYGSYEEDKYHRLPGFVNLINYIINEGRIGEITFLFKYEDECVRDDIYHKSCWHLYSVY